MTLRQNSATMTAMSVAEGNFLAGGFPALLRTLVKELADGRLELVSRRATRTLWLDAGQVRAVISSSEEEKLGRWLVSRGLLDAGQMALALLRQPEGVRFGAHLVQEGLIEFAALQQELESLAVSIVARLIMPPATYRFLPGERLPIDAATLEMTSASLLMAAVRRAEDVDELEHLIEPVHYLRGVEDAVLRFQRVKLTTHEAYLLSRIDGTKTAVQLRRVAPLPPAEFTRSLAALLAAGIVECTLQAASRPIAPPQATSVAGNAGEDALQYTQRQQREYERVLEFANEVRHLDFYRRLDLTPRATADEIREGYQELTRKFHPDRAREPHLHLVRRELATIQSALHEAYQALVDPERRAPYDADLARGVRRPPEVAREEARRSQAQLEVAQANVRRAQEAIRVNDVGLAVQLLDQAVRFDPKPENLLMLARLEFRNPMWAQRGLDHLRQAVTVDPRFTEGWLELARFWAKKQRHDRQCQCLERVLAYDPHNREALTAMKPAKKRS